jgi:hypothetical protein
VKRSKVKVVPFQNKKVSKERQNTKVSAFSGQALEGVSDAYLKWKKFKGTPEYRSLSLWQSSTRRRWWCFFWSKKVSMERQKTEASAFGGQPLESEGDTFLNDKISNKRNYANNRK